MKTRPAFTLLELLISVALVLVLILGVNVVFSMTTQTVGAGNALGTAYRANQSAHGVIYQDFRSMIVGSEAPCFVISMQRRSAFRNAADREADKDGDPRTLDINGDGDESDAGENLLINVAYNHRNRRIDKIAFFARGKFSRQTGTADRFWDAAPGGSTAIPLSSDEAWVRYGFLSLPDNATPPVYRQPAHDADVNGRPLFNPRDNPNNFYSTQWILGRQVTVLTDNPGITAGAYTGPVNDTTPLQPLDPISTAAGETGEPLQNNRYDVALTRMSRYRVQVANAPASGTFRQLYWQLHGDFYFRGNNLVTKPVDPAAVSRLLPVFVPNCSHFAVEFSGDFVGQDADGIATSEGPDGVPDYMVSGPTNGRVRSTRWYGYPRDVDGDGVIQKENDVVPVFESFGGTHNKLAFERDRTTHRYLCGWGADAATADTNRVGRPSMLRFTLVVDDDRISEGQVFEYVGAVR